MATLSLTVASCDFCSSDRRFASTFLQIPLALIIVVAMKRTPLVLAVSFPLLGRIRDFHPLETCAARRTQQILPGKYRAVQGYVIQLSYANSGFKASASLSFCAFASARSLPSVVKYVLIFGSVPDGRTTTVAPPSRV